MLRKCCLETEKNWDEGVPFVLFTALEVIQDPLVLVPHSYFLATRREAW